MKNNWNKYRQDPFFSLTEKVTPQAHDKGKRRHTPKSPLKRGVTSYSPLERGFRGVSPFVFCLLLLLLACLSACGRQAEGGMAVGGTEEAISLAEVHQPSKVGQCAMAIAELSRQEKRDKREVAANQGLEVSYDEETNTILVAAGEEVTLPQLSQALEKPDLLQELTAGEWLLAANLQINKGASVEISAPDVHWLKLKSDNEGFVWIKARGGQLEFSETCVTSWDVAAQDYHQNGDESVGRSFVLARDGAQMNILDSELSYLGYQAGESYGVAWRLAGTSGKIEGSILGYNHYGLYTYDVSGLVIRDNEVHHSTKYGIDPHTNSNQLLIEKNISHHNGKHGIILAEGCTDSIIRDNIVYQNTLHGIVLYEHSNNNTIEENRSYANGQQGININNSSSNIILNNTVFSNTLAGIGIGSQASDNLVTNNEAYDNLLDGIYLFSDATRNILQGNYIHHNARHGIYIKSSDNHLPSGNEVTHNQVGVYLNTDAPPIISLELNNIYENIEIDIRRGE